MHPLGWLIPWRFVKEKALNLRTIDTVVILDDRQLVVASQALTSYYSTCIFAIPGHRTTGLLPLAVSAALTRISGRRLLACHSGFYYRTCRLDRDCILGLVVEATPLSPIPAKKKTVVEPT